MLNVSRPNKKRHLALLYSSFGLEQLEDPCFKELMVESNTDEFNSLFNYAIYSDTSSVKENILIPMFHTYYLGSDVKEVIILEEQMYSIIEVYKYHKYYLYGKKTELEDSINKIKDVLPSASVTVIESIKEIYNEVS